MKVNGKQVPLNEQEILAGFYESDGYKVYKKWFIDEMKADIAASFVNASDYPQVEFLKGQVWRLNKNLEELKQLHANEMKRQSGK